MKCQYCDASCKEDFLCDECRGDLELCQELDYYGRWGYLDDKTRARLVSKEMISGVASVVVCTPACEAESTGS